MFRVLGLVVFYLVSFSLAASQCTNIFPDGISNHRLDGNARIDFGFNAQLLNNPDNILNTADLRQNDGSTLFTCETADCEANNFPSEELDPGDFQTTSVNTDIVLDFQESVVIGSGQFPDNEYDVVNRNNASEATITFSDTHQEYFIDRLNLDFANELNLQGGATYWIRRLDTSSEVKINVLGSGTATIYVERGLTFAFATEINSSGINQRGDASRLAVYAYNNVTFNNQSTFSGLLYSQRNITLGSASHVFGAISGVRVVLESDSTVSYDSAALLSSNFNGFCGEEIGPVAFYQYEDNGFLTDSTANNNNGSAIGGITRVDLIGEQTCSVLDVPLNESRTNNDAFDTQVNIEQQLGNTGTISLWYRSDRDWNLGSTTNEGRRQLFDASTSGNTGKFFFLALQGDGRLTFGLEDESDRNARLRTDIFNFRAGEWVHVAVTWDVLAQDIQVYVNGVVANATFPELAIRGDLGPTDSLYVGDNRIPNILGLGDTENSANGQFDDVRLYNFAQNAAQIAVDMDSQNLFLCEPEVNNNPLALYQYDIDAPTEDSVNDNDGQLIDFASIIQQNETQFCSILDIPQNTTNTQIYAFDTGVDVNRDLGDNGTISFWYRSNERFDSGNPRVLFDASNGIGSGVDSANDLNRRLKFFYLALNPTGQLEFSYEDTLDSEITSTTNVLNDIEAQEWVHISAVWDVVEEIAFIYINGRRADTTTNVRISETARQIGSGFGERLNVNGSGRLGELLSLHIGDNRLEEDGRVSFGEIPGLTASANGQFDDVRLYSIAQSQREIQQDADLALTTCQGVEVVNHYRLIHSGIGFTCAATDVTVLACADENCQQMSTISTSIGLTATNDASFSPANLVFTGASASALSKPTAGVTQIGIANAVPNAPLQCFVDGIRNDTCTIDFSVAGLDIEFGAGGNTQPNLIAQTPIDQIISVSINPACSANISGRELQVATQCENPASCQSGQLRLDDNVSPSTDNFNNTGIFFDNSGVAQINANRLQYDDAGQIRLLFRDFSTVDNLSLASGQTNSFISIPMGFETIYTEPESLLAGMEYPIAYRAVGAEGRVTPNYQPSVLQLRANKIFPGNDQGRQGTVSLGAAAVLTTDDGASDFNNVANDALGFQDGMTQDLTISYSEAGDFELTIQDSDYLMSGSVIPSEVGAFGRFLPAYLSVVSEDSMIAQCTDTFNYFGQNIGYIQNADITLSGQPNVVVHPVDVTGVQIHNFDGETGFYTPDDSQLGNVTYTESTNTTIVERVTAGRSELLNPELYDGEFAIYIRDNELRFPKSDLPAAPLVAGTVTMLVPAPLFSNSINNHELCIRDEFNGECVGVGIGSDNSNGINVRWGRLSLINVFGSELETLLVPFRAEYYDGSSFITNIDDSCTTISLDLNADDLTVDSTLITMANTGANGSSSFSAITLSGGNSLSGLDGLYVSPPGEMAEVTIQIDTATPLIGVDWQDYLNFDWDGNGVIQSGIDEPSVTILFGQYRGNDRIIHWREVFNLA